MPSDTSGQAGIVLLRVDANETIGTGHLHRCVNLALELRSRGFEPRFVLGQTDTTSQDFLGRYGFVIHRLAKYIRTFSDGSVGARVPESEILDDAAAVSEIISETSCEFLVVDHYSLDDRWASRVRLGADCRILVIDDLGRTWSNVDVVVDGNLSPSRIPESSVGCLRLLGPQYAILHPLYKTLQERPHRDNGLPRLLIFLGGVDKQNFTSVALRSILKFSVEPKSILVIIGGSNPHADRLKEEFAGAGIGWLRPSDSMHAHLVEADVAVGAAGTTTWERLCVGTPSVVVSIAENQIGNGVSLDRAGCHVYIGSVDEMADDVIGRSVDLLLADRSLCASLSLAGRKLVDGFGASRVCEALVPTPPEMMSLRKVKPADAMTLYRWRNEPDTRRSSINQDELDWDGHNVWLSHELGSEKSIMLIGELNGMPVAQVRFNEVGRYLNLSYSVDPTQRGRGLGHRIVAEGLRYIDGLKGQEVRADVKTSNVPSLAVFRAAGFLETQADSSGVVRFVRKASRD